MMNRHARSALSSSVLAIGSARRLRAAADRGDLETVERAAAECVEPFMRAAIQAMEIAGLLSQKRSAAVRDVISDYLSERGS